MKLDFYVGREDHNDLIKIKKGFNELNGNFSKFVVFAIKKSFINGDWDKFILGGKDENKKMRQIKINKID